MVPQALGTNSSSVGVGLLSSQNLVLKFFQYQRIQIKKYFSYLNHWNLSIFFFSCQFSYDPCSVKELLGKQVGLPKKIAGENFWFSTQKFGNLCPCTKAKEDKEGWSAEPSQHKVPSKLNTPSHMFLLDTMASLRLVFHPHTHIKKNAKIMGKVCPPCHQGWWDYKSVMTFQDPETHIYFFYCY